MDGHLADADSTILAFYRLTGTDAAGRFLPEVMAFSNSELESVHNYVQWLFPLPEASGASPTAPILTAGDIAAFRTDPILQQRLRQSMALMFEFYGFTTEDPLGVVTVRLSSHFERRKTVWLLQHNHNLLRITRMLRSLSILGLHEYSVAWLACLERLYGPYRETISERTMAFWRGAVAGSELPADRSMPPSPSSD